MLSYVRSQEDIMIPKLNSQIKNINVDKGKCSRLRPS